MTDVYKAEEEGFVPTTENKILLMSLIEAVRSISTGQESANRTLASLQSGIHHVELQLVRFEGLAAKMEKFEERFDRLESDVSQLTEEKARRAGMQWLIEWSVKFIPWLFAAAAAVWALRVTGS